MNEKNSPGKNAVISFDELNKLLDAQIFLRDYFAGKALIALLGNNQNADISFGEIANLSYDIADLMLQVRSK